MSVLTKIQDTAQKFESANEAVRRESEKQGRKVKASNIPRQPRKFAFPVNDDKTMWQFYTVQPKRMTRKNVSKTAQEFFTLSENKGKEFVDYHAVSAQRYYFEADNFIRKTMGNLFFSGLKPDSMVLVLPHESAAITGDNADSIMEAITVQRESMSNMGRVLLDIMNDDSTWDEISSLMAEFEALKNPPTPDADAQ